MEPFLEFLGAYALQLAIRIPSVRGEGRVAREHAVENGQGPSIARRLDYIPG